MENVGSLRKVEFRLRTQFQLNHSFPCLFTPCACLHSPAFGAADFCRNVVVCSESPIFEIGSRCFHGVMTRKFGRYKGHSRMLLRVFSLWFAGLVSGFVQEQKNPHAVRPVTQSSNRGFEHVV